MPHDPTVPNNLAPDEGGGFTRNKGLAMQQILGSAGDVAGLFGGAERGGENAAKLALFKMLGQGGGVRNAREIGQNEFDLFRNERRGFGGVIPDEVATAMRGRGPGGGLGVFSNIDEFSKQNMPELEGPGFMEKLMGGLKLGASIAGMFTPAGGGGGGS